MITLSWQRYRGLILAFFFTFFYLVSPQLHAGMSGRLCLIIQDLQFVDSWAEKSVASVSENKKFITLMGNKSARKIVFRVENSKLKYLNDIAVQNKKAIDAMNNLLQSLVLGKINGDPVLKEAMLAYHVDYKSLNVAFSPDTPELAAKLQRIYQESLTELEAQLRAQDLLPKDWLQSHSFASSNDWFSASTGSNFDEAEQAARYGRGQSSQVLPFDDIQHLIPKDFAHFTERSTELLATIKKSSNAFLKRSFSSLNSKFLVPNTEVLTLLRKYSGLPEEEFIQKMTAYFGQPVDRKFVVQLQDYYKSLDQMMVGPLQAERVKLSYGHDAEGFLSVDFSGMGVRNAQSLLDELAKLPANPSAEQIVAAQREGFDLATELFDQQKAQMKGAFSGIGISADDGIKPLLAGEEASIIPRLQASTQNIPLRSVLVSGTYSDTGAIIPEISRGKLAVGIEEIEKTLRMKLIGLHSNVSSSFAFKFVPNSTGGGTVQMFPVGHLDASELSTVRTQMDQLMSTTYAQYQWLGLVL